MKQDQDKRRSFLKHILAGSAVVVGAAAALQPVKAKSAPARMEADEVLYRESPEFSKYYKSLRS